MASLTIHQALFGYRDGHQLLAASKELPASILRQLLVLSDMSGPEMIEGFETYLTGYPIPEIKSFAIARTWYADEMSRPGCVYTHTLLVEFSDLKALRCPSILLECFRRPSKTDPKHTSYSASITLSYTEIDIEPSPSLEPVLGHLYARSDQPVVYFSDKPDRLVRDILEVWGQQWPKLRRNFFFSTGSLANRSFNGRRFDLQVTSRRLARSFSDREMLQVDLLMAKVNVFPDWVAVAVHDIRAGGSRFREKMWYFATDVTPSRASFRSVAVIVNFAQAIENRDRPLTDLLTQIGRCFPLPNEARKLKLAVVGSTELACNRLVPSVTESERLRAISWIPDLEAFRLDDLDIEPRVHRLESKSDLFFELLAEESLNEVGVALVTSLESRLASAHYPDKLPRKALWRILDTISRWHTNDTVWSLFERRLYLEDDDFQQQIATALLKVSVDLDLVRGYDIARRLRGESFVTDVLEALSGSGLQRVPEGLVRCIDSSLRTAVRWLETTMTQPPVALLSHLAARLKPEEAKDVSPDVWLPLVSMTPDQIEQRALAFAFACGMQTDEPVGAELVARPFQGLHDMARLNRLSYSAWLVMEPFLPSNKTWFLSWHGWDRCETLRRGYVEAFATKNWSCLSFSKGVTDDDTFSRAIAYSKTTVMGQELIVRLYRQRENLDEFQRRIIEPIADRWDVRRKLEFCDAANSLIPVRDSGPVSDETSPRQSCTLPTSSSLAVEIVASSVVPSVLQGGRVPGPAEKRGPVNELLYVFKLMIRNRGQDSDSLLSISGEREGGGKVTHISPRFSIALPNGYFRRQTPASGPEYWFPENPLNIPGRSSVSIEVWFTETVAGSPTGEFSIQLIGTTLDRTIEVECPNLKAEEVIRF